MATLTGGRIRTPRGVLSWQPVAPVARAYARYTEHAKDGYVCAGVMGNQAHLARRPPEDHTPYSEGDTTINGKHYVPKPGWVYAIDGHVPDQVKFEKWFLGRLRAGFYKSVKYFNINGRHWNRRNGFKTAWRSSDHHLHVSVMPGSEYSTDDYLGDYEVFRTTGKNVAGKVPVAAPAKPGVLDVTVRKLPPVRRGHATVLVGLVQAALVAREYLPAKPESVDKDFGPKTESAVKVQQKAAGLPQTGVVDGATWGALFPNSNPVVSRGDDGYYALLMQALLYVRGFNPGPLDGAFGDGSVAALKRFQVARKVKNSVVKGRGDGIGGAATWIALVTI
jgi:peptidoglycan hydrolase-like protein with peptidoglycan-binding domain